MITAELSKIRPFEDVIIRARGNRLSTDVCFQPGAQSSILETLEGSQTQSKTVSNLADGNREFQVTPLSGGDQMPVASTFNFVAGTTHQLLITGNVAGDLEATFS